MQTNAFQNQDKYISNCRQIGQSLFSRAALHTSWASAEAHLPQIFFFGYCCTKDHINLRNVKTGATKHRQACLLNQLCANLTSVLFCFLLWEKKEFPKAINMTPPFLRNIPSHTRQRIINCSCKRSISEKWDGVSPPVMLIMKNDCFYKNYKSSTGKFRCGCCCVLFGLLAASVLLHQA